MGPAELRWRIQHGYTVRMERMAFHLGSYTLSPQRWVGKLCQGIENQPAANELVTWWQNHMRSRQEPSFLLDADTLEQSARLYPRLFPERLDSLRAEADRVCRGKFSFLGIDFQAGPEIEWQQDPVTRKNWPAKFYADLKIPFCEQSEVSNTPGDSKHVWEMNRHDFLIDCARAYYLSRDEKYSKRVGELVSAWIFANPYLEGVNWAGPLEVALRSMAWLWAYQFCRTSNCISAEAHCEWIKSFYRHGQYLSRHLEVYSSPNNHLVGEATALYLLGSFFPEFAGSTNWRNRAWSILAQQPEKQFYSDGGSTEQAISYHHYCLGFFLIAVLTRMRQQFPVPAIMQKRLEKAFEFSMWMTTPDGTVPRIGDTDDARSIRLGPFLPWDFRNLLSIGAILFRRGDFKAIAEGFSEDALWLLGAQGTQTFEELPDSFLEETVRVFPSSGYAILRNWEQEGHHTCFDCGDIGIGLRRDDVAIFTHGHADMLSLTISSFGKPLLVDAGFYTYNGSPDWHRYTRDVQGHNTVRLDGQSQAKFHKRNAWARVLQPGPMAWKSDTNFECVQGCHNGFLDIENCKNHRRAVIWNRESCWLILDRLEGVGEHYVEVFFHFAPGQLQSNDSEECATIVTDEGIHATIQAVNSTTLKIDASCGGLEPDQGWIATGYGRKVPAPQVRYHGNVRLPCILPFVLTASQEPIEPSIVTFAETKETPSRDLLDSIKICISKRSGEELLKVGSDIAVLEH